MKNSSRFFLSFLFFRNFFFLLLRVLFLEVLSCGVVQNAALVSHHCKFLLANLNCYSYLHLHCRTCPNQKGVGYKSCIIWFTWGAMFVLFLLFVNLSFVGHCKSFISFGYFSFPLGTNYTNLRIS